MGFAKDLQGSLEFQGFRDALVDDIKSRARDVVSPDQLPFGAFTISGRDLYDMSLGQMSVLNVVATPITPPTEAED